MIDFDSVIADSSQWDVFAYKPEHDERYGHHDANNTPRFALLITLLKHPEIRNKELIRFLLKEEIQAREEDSFQGFGDALYLACYLMLPYAKPADLCLFHQAKVANFDTCCGFDIEFLFYPLKHDTLSYLQDHMPKVYAFVKESYPQTDFINTLEDWHHGLSARLQETYNNE